MLVRRSLEVDAMSHQDGLVQIGMIRTWREREPDSGFRVRITTYAEGMRTQPQQYLATTVEEAVDLLADWLHECAGRAAGTLSEG